MFRSFGAYHNNVAYISSSKLLSVLDLEMFSRHNTPGFTLEKDRGGGLSGPKTGQQSFSDILLGYIK